MGEPQAFPNSQSTPYPSNFAPAYRYKSNPPPQPKPGPILKPIPISPKIPNSPYPYNFVPSYRYQKVSTSTPLSTTTKSETSSSSSFNLSGNPTDKKESTTNIFGGKTSPCLETTLLTTTTPSSFGAPSITNTSEPGPESSPKPDPFGAPKATTPGPELSEPSPEPSPFDAPKITTPSPGPKSSPELGPEPSPFGAPSVNLVGNSTSISFSTTSSSNLLSNLFTAPLSRTFTAVSSPFGATTTSIASSFNIPTNSSTPKTTTTSSPGPSPSPFGAPKTTTTPSPGPSPSPFGAPKTTTTPSPGPEPSPFGAPSVNLVGNLTSTSFSTTSSSNLLSNPFTAPISGTFTAFSSPFGDPTTTSIASSFKIPTNSSSLETSPSATASIFNAPSKAASTPRSTLFSIPLTGTSSPSPFGAPSTSTTPSPFGTPSTTTKSPIGAPSTSTTPEPGPESSSFSAPSTSSTPTLAQMKDQIEENLQTRFQQEKLIFKLNEQNKELVDQIEILKEQLAQSNNEDQINQLNLENNQLKDQIESLKQQDRDKEELLNQIEKVLNQDNKEIIDQIDSLNNNDQNEQYDNAKYENDIDLLKEELESLKQQQEKEKKDIHQEFTSQIENNRLKEDLGLSFGAPSTQPSQSPQSKNKFVGGSNLFYRPSPYLVQSTPQQELPTPIITPISKAPLSSSITITNATPASTQTPIATPQPTQQSNARIASSTYPKLLHQNPDTILQVHHLKGEILENQQLKYSMKNLEHGIMEKN
ncbi:hypothetical protein DICPUDRAFT_149834 [Dictyostelium purpureum]|uniref:Uncharacterized protein n=1 Tax=Dictyostelium purpureum TaxID=5786 RepID=F0ZES3_DICPU|nr:uncharacterized protein DICPUDRAFT_149834 [Dictyostelium purpureum]EGC37542.1 hypothetical protein DICPUDRAFT_149834 [Dictyostelium purpureum]|eukprot:XP_003285933.1 hypothetical protein DICPUDRAFT_149834 [Dictyostelium purpureum]